MRRLFKNKSKFLAGICCLCLGVASLLAGAFSFAYAPAKAEEVVDANTGFYVEKGAAFRYDTEVPAIRFAVSLTKAQWEAYKLDKEYTDDMVVKIEASIGITGRPNRPNEDTTLSSGYALVFQDVSVKTINNYFANEKNEGKPFTVKPAVILTNTWKGETTEGKTPAQLYALYANAEFHVAGIRLSVNGDVLATKDTDNGLIDKALTLRSVRALSASLLAQDKVASEYVNTAKAFLINEDGSKAEIVNKDIKAYYDKYVDTGVIDVTEFDTATLESADKVAIGSTKVTASGVVDGKVTISEAALTLADGETYTVNYDCGDKIYSLKGLIAATEIFYQTNSKGETGVARLNARFAIENAPADMTAKVETYVKDGVEYSATFYGVDRGYYVLGEDVDFGGDPMTNPSSSNALFHSNVNIGSYSGLAGFGGTFDGNGYAVKHVRFNRNLSNGNPLGFFGWLAYGATIKNFAMVETYPRHYNGAHRHGALLAYSTGASMTALDGGKEAQQATYDYLVAKYGSTDCVTIDNCYFGVSRVTLADIVELDPSWKDVFPYNNLEDATFNLYNVSTSNINRFRGFGVVHQGAEEFLTIKNSVLDIPASNDIYGGYNEGGIGWVASARDWQGNKADGYLDLGILENCFQITEDNKYGRVATGFDYSEGQYNNGSSWNGGANLPRTTEKQNIRFNPSTFTTIYASNDYTEIADGTKIYSAFEVDSTKEKWIVSTNPAEIDKDANNLIYHYQGLHRYDNYTDMVMNNTASTEGFNDKWSKVGGAVIWNGLAEEKTIEVEVSKQAGEVGDVINVTAKYGEEDATSLITLSTDNSDILSIDNQKKEVTLSMGGEATLFVTANGHSSAYTIVATNTNKTAVTISSNHSAVYGLTDAYSVPYVLAENGKDLVATDFLTIYRKHVGDNDATVSNVYLLDANGEKNALNAVNVEGVSQYLFENAGNVKQALSIIVDGSYGYMSFADISSVTAVITDTAGFNYIPSTEESRSGYYVLGNDYNNTKRADGTFTKRQDSILGNPVGSSDQLGYSMGGFSEERYNVFKQNETTFNSNMTSIQRLSNMYNAFLGTFDGLGHTIDNMFIDSVGLLGGYRYETDGSTLKNVKLTNVRMSIYAQYTPYVDGKVDVKISRSTIFATLCYSGSALYKRLEESERINVENVVVELATTAHRDYSDFYGASNGENLYWQMFRGAKAVTVNEDGTYKGDDNYNDTERSQRNVHLKDVVLKYKIGPNVGANASSNGGGIIFSYIDQSSSKAALQSSYAFSAFENVYIISAPASNGKVAFVCSEQRSSDKATFLGMAKNDFYSIFSEEYNANGNTGLYYYHLNLTEKGHVTNKTDALYGFEFDSTCVDNYLTGSTANITSGWGYITTTNEDGSTSTRWVYTNDVTTYGAAGSQYECASNEVFTRYENAVDGRTYTVFYPTPFERYDDYEAMAKAGKTQVGNFAITADGIVWSPAK